MTKEQFLKVFAIELAKERKRLRISQQEILDETGINIARIEAMERCPGLFCYYQLCLYIGIPFETILAKISFNKNIHNSNDQLVIGIHK